jgi:ATP-dependent Clp protease ATP-binding subunit ClpA
MFGRFTDEARRVLDLALDEARTLNSNRVGTEHILLGLVREGEGPAIQVLLSLGQQPGQVRQHVTDLARRQPDKEEPWTARSAGRHGKAVGKRKVLSGVLAQLESIETRLTALESRVGAGPDVRDLDREVAQVRQDKEAAIDMQDFEAAAALYGREKQLLSDRAARQEEWATAHRDVPSLTAEIERLHALLRQHGIEPRDGAA